MSIPRRAEEPGGPGPAPEGPPVMAMRWHDLLFAHWPLPAGELRPLLPRGLELDLHEGRAWIGVVPFRMEGVRPRRVPALPGLSWFPEINVRTYVRAAGLAGVWFFSLDAGSRLAVRAARLLFHLPYFDARMGVVEEGGRLLYESRRVHRGAPAAGFSARYAPTGPAREASAGGLEHWLTARYRMFVRDGGGRILRCEVRHAPWLLQRAEAEILSNTMLDPLGMGPPSGPPLLHFARRTVVEAWRPRAVAAARS